MNWLCGWMCIYDIELNLFRHDNDMVAQKVLILYKVLRLKLRNLFWIVSCVFEKIDT